MLRSGSDGDDDDAADRHHEQSEGSTYCEKVRRRRFRGSEYHSINVCIRKRTFNHWIQKPCFSLRPNDSFETVSRSVVVDSVDLVRIPPKKKSSFSRSVWHSIPILSLEAIHDRQSGCLCHGGFRFAYPVSASKVLVLNIMCLLVTFTVKKKRRQHMVLVLP